MINKNKGKNLRLILEEIKNKDNKWFIFINFIKKKFFSNYLPYNYKLFICCLSFNPI